MWAPTDAVFVYDFPTDAVFIYDFLSGAVYVAGDHDDEKNALRSWLAYDPDADAWAQLPDMARSATSRADSASAGTRRRRRAGSLAPRSPSTRRRRPGRPST